MIFIAPRSIDDTQIAVTGTATLLYELMGTAGSANPSVVQGYYSADGNAAWLYCATNSFRFAFGTPTAGKGALVQTGERRLVMGDLSTLKLIRTGGSNATVDVEIGRASEYESVFGMANTASVTVTADTEFSAASAASDAYTNPTSTTDVKSLGHSFNGTTWDRNRSAVITPSATLTGMQNTLPWAIYNATPTTRTEGQGGPLQASTLGEQLCVVRDAAGNNRGANVDSSNRMSVLASQTGTWTVQGNKAEDDNSTNGNPGFPTLAVRHDTPGLTSGSDLDYEFLQLGNGRLYVEQNYTPFSVTADTQVAGAAGFLHSVSFSPLTATPTAGLITIYDSLTETGTVLYSEWFSATTPGHTITLNVRAGTGIYVGYDGTAANIRVSGSFRLNT